MHDLALGDPGCHTALNRPLKDAPKPLGAPALPNTGQRRMIRKPLVEAIASKPADREIDLCLSHKTPVMDDPEKKAGQHETDGCLWRDPWPAGSGGIKIGNVLGQPAEIEHPVDAGKDMIIRHKVTQRTANEKLQLIPVLMTNHPGPRDKVLKLWNQRS